MDIQWVPAFTAAPTKKASDYLVEDTCVAASIELEPKRSVMASEGGECKGTREADAVFYKGYFAYDAQPKESRHIELIHKIDMDEELTESELQELEPLRMPFADIQNTTSVDGSKGSVLSILNAPWPQFPA